MKRFILITLLPFFSVHYSYSQIADTAKARQFIDQAETLKTEKKVSLFLKAREIYDRARQYEKALEVTEKLAAFYQRREEYQEALKYTQEGLERTIERCDTLHEETSMVYLALGDIYGKLGRQEEQLEAYQKCRIAREYYFGKNDPALHWIHGKLGSCYALKADYHKNLYHSERALELSEISGRGLSLVKYINAGIGSTSIGDYTRAKHYFKAGLAYAQTAKKVSKKHVGHLYYHLANVYYRTVDYSQMLLNLQKARENLEGVANASWLIAQTYTQLGLCYAERGQYKEALNYLFKAEKLGKTYSGTQRTDNLVRGYISLGRCYKQMKEYEMAKRYGLKVVQEARAGQTTIHKGMAVDGYNLIGNIFLEAENYDSAAYYFEKAVATVKETLGEDHVELMGSYNYLGQAFAKAKRFDEALTKYQQAMHLNFKNFTDPDYRESPQANINHILDRFEAINSLNLKASALREQYIDQPGEHRESLQLSIKNYQIATRLVDAIMQDIGEEHSRYLFNHGANDIYEGGLQTSHLLYEETGNTKYLDQAFYFAERGKSQQLFEAIKSLNASNSLGIPDSLILLERELNTRKTLLQKRLSSYSAYDTSEAQKATKAAFEAAQQEFNQLFSYYEEYYPEYFKLKYDMSAVQLSEVQNFIKKKNTALVSFHWGREWLFTFYLKGTQTHLTKTKITKGLQASIEAFRKSVSDYTWVLDHPKESYQTLTQEGYQLYNQLLPASMQETLSQSGNLIIVPDGPLNYVPFEALMTQKVVPSKERKYKQLPYLIKRAQVSYAYSVKLLLQKEQKQSAPKSYLGFAPSYNAPQLAQAVPLSRFSRFGESLMKLSGNQDEVERSSQLMQGTHYISYQASEAQFKKEASNYRILHLAMHALTDDEQPLESKFIFTTGADSIEDGFLNAYELYNMKLNADLAVLSACNTGYGKLRTGEGPMSLARAFRYAGCPSIVMSLWRADDASASQMVVDFFNQLTQGETKSKALQFAKMQYLETADGLMGHPYFWSNFVLIGDPAPFNDSRIPISVFVILGALLGTAGGMGYRQWKRHKLKKAA